ncbi:MAG: mechanosensitive ion channel family protein [Prevotellaceae bacterium]|jgi:small-conductance mechanosensitive channel|nr:mechanosensitive ion channel family protein [Prevotellaceae bacterium]
MAHFRFLLLLTLSFGIAFPASGEPEASLSNAVDSTAIQDSLQIIKFKQAVQQLGAVAPNGVPVVIDGDTLFLIYIPVGEVSPERRAEGVQNDILALGKDQQVNPDSIRLMSLKYYTGIMYGEKIIMSVTESDANWLNANRNSLAETYRIKIIDEIKKEQEKNSSRNIFLRIGEFILVLVSIIVIFFLLNLLLKKLTKYIIYLSQTTLKSVHIKNYELLNTKKEANLLISLANLVRYILIIITLIIAIPIIFSIFPSTKRIGEKLFSYIFNPAKSIFQGMIDYIPNLFTIVIIVLCIRILIKGLNFLATEVQHGRLKISNFYPDWAMPTFHIIRFLLYAFMIAMIYPYLPGAQSGVFQGISVFVGVIISLGSTAVIGNIIAGLVTTYMRPFKMGDLIKVNETTGYVIEKTPFVTRVRTLKNEVITIPNASMLSSQTINYNTSADNYGLIIHTVVGVQYNTPWQKIHELLIKAAKMTDGVLTEKEPFVLELGFENLYPQYQINAYIKDITAYQKINSDLHSNIQTVFNEAGVNLQTPFVVSQEEKKSAAI